MASLWSEIKDYWLTNNVVSDEVSRWAIDVIDKNESDISKIEELVQSKAGLFEQKSIEELLKLIKKKIKTEIAIKEKDLDNVSLNPPNSYKLQVSIPANLNYLMKTWAAAEGRDLSSVALQCLEIGLTEMKSKGSIPFSALRRYDLACEKRIALAELNNAWEEHEELNLKRFI